MGDMTIGRVAKAAGVNVETQVPGFGSTSWPRTIAAIMCGGPHGLSPFNILSFRE